MSDDVWEDIAVGAQPVVDSGWEDVAIGAPADPVVPSILENPIDAVSSKDWWKSQALQTPLALLNGLTFGMGDEITAGGNAVIDALRGKAELGDAYDQRLAQARQIEAETPLSTQLTTGLLGGFKLPIPSLVGKAASALPKAETFVQAAKNAGTLTKALAKEGAGYGAAYGFGAGEGGVADRISNAGEGALSGAALSTVLGAPVLAGGELVGLLANSPSKFNPLATSEQKAAAILNEAGGDAIRNMAQESTSPLYKYATVAEATQNPKIAQLEQSIMKESTLGNSLLNENTIKRQMAQQELLKSIASVPQRTQELAGNEIRANVLAPKAERAAAEVEKLYGRIDESAEVPFKGLRNGISKLVSDTYKAGGVPPSIESIRREVNTLVQMGEVKGKPNVQTHGYLQDLRERASQAWLDLKNFNDRKGAAVANQIVRKIDKAILSGDPANRVPFLEAKTAAATSAELYGSGAVGSVLRKLKEGVYSVEDSAVLDKLWTETPKGTEAILKAIGSDAKAIENFRGALRDKILRETTDRDGNITWTKYSDWIKRNKEALTKTIKVDGKPVSIMDGSHVTRLRQIGEDLALFAPGSARSTKRLAFRGSEGQPTTAQALMMAADSGYKKIAPAWAVGMLNLARKNFDTGINDILARALMDKDFARVLVTKTNPANQGRIASALRRGIASSRKPLTPLSRLGSQQLAGGSGSVPTDRKTYQSLSAPLPLQRSEEAAAQQLQAKESLPSPKSTTTTPLSKDFNSKLDQALEKALKIIDEGQTMKRDASGISDEFIAPIADAVQWQESRGKADAISTKGATGLMQIMPDTAREIAKELGVKDYDLKDPATNRAFGEYYLKKMLAMFDGDIELALAAYNAGPGRVREWVKQYGNDWSAISDALKSKGYYQETVAYVPSVKKRIKTVEV